MVGDGGIARVAPDGTTTTIAAAAATLVAVDDRYVYYASGNAIDKACK